MKLKRSLALVLALLMVLPLAACSKGDKDEDTAATTTAADTTTTTTVEPAGDDDGDVVDPDTGDDDGGAEPDANATTVTNADGTPVTTTVATGSDGKPVATTTVKTKKTLKTTTTTKKSGQAATMGAINIKSGTTPVEKGLNFGGKTYRFAYYGSSWDEQHDGWHKDFEKQYNVKLSIDAVPMSNYVNSLASALAAGKPYDIVFFYSFDYPSQITANLMQPLDDYITTADMWTSKSVTEGGYSKSLAQALSLNGHVYCVGGNYLQTVTGIWYNKKEFSKAGYTGAKDPLALYKAGKWDWQTLYDMLYAIQDVDNNKYGINAIAPYYEAQFICSFDTNLAKLTSDGRLVENLSDSKLYEAFEMLQKFCYGEHKVANMKDQYDSGRDQFENGTTVSVLSTMGAYWTFYSSIPKASAFDKSMNNLGFVPLPTYGSNGPTVIWDWMGYGAGAGASKEGVLCALAFAKHDSINNHNQAYHPNMPADLKKLSCSLLDSDNLIGPMDGFKTSAGSLGSISTSISIAVAQNGQKPTVVLKGYKKMAEKVINAALTA